jgi:predicted  nucleic acid-binding Zn-ribbon protein
MGSDGTIPASKRAVAAPATEDPMTEPSNDLRKNLENGLSELETLADEIRVRLHLGGMDAKDAWRKLEPKLEDARQHVKEATAASEKVLEDIVQAFKNLRSSL